MSPRLLEPLRLSEYTYKKVLLNNNFLKGNIVCLPYYITVVLKHYTPGNATRKIFLVFQTSAMCARIYATVGCFFPIQLIGAVYENNCALKKPLCSSSVLVCLLYRPAFQLLFSKTVKIVKFDEEAKKKDEACNLSREKLGHSLLLVYQLG